MQDLRQRKLKHLRKNKTAETYINTVMFILQHHLQHLIIGFRMSSKIQFLTLDTGKSTAIWKKFQKMKQNLLKVSVPFCHFYIFCLIILIWILATLTSTLEGTKQT